MSAEEAKSRATRLLGEVGLTRPESQLSKHPHELSGGMLQRVMIASALANDPELLLADEPTTALDVTMQAEIMQMVFQDPYQSVDPRQTPREALSEIVAVHTSRRGAELQKLVQELLDQVSIDERAASRRPRDLPGGQRQRFAIARALAAEPELLILEEAVAALDVSIQAQVLRLLDEIRRELGVALLFVSHDLEVVRWITEEVLVMFHGNTVERGLTSQVLEQPERAYTRLLLASVPSLDWDPRSVADARRAFLEAS